MKKHILILGLGMIATLVGCSHSDSNSPSDSEIHKMIDGRLVGEYKDLFKLSPLKKTDGLAQDIMGTKVYSAKYAFEMEFIGDYYYQLGIDREACPAFIITTKEQAAEKEATMKASGLYAAYRISNPDPYGQLFKAGTKMQMETAVDFEKHEQGWILTKITTRTVKVLP